MLIISYIFTAGLELVIVYNSLIGNTWSLVWTYSFLLMITVFSVHAEDSKSGKAARKFFTKIGIKSEKYDFISNLLKISIYLMVLTNIISYHLGAFLSYLVIFITVVLIYTKFSDILKKDNDKSSEE